MKSAQLSGKTNHVFQCLMCVFFFLTAVMISSTNAATPQLISYQAQLKDNLGAPLNQTVNVVFTIWDAPAGANALWIETHNSLAITDGKLSVLLGSLTPLDDALFSDSGLYLGVKVGLDNEISPRSRLTAVPYAYRISTIDGATGGDVSGALLISPDQAKVEGDALIIKNDIGQTILSVKVSSLGVAVVSLFDPVDSKDGFGAVPIEKVQITMDGIIILDSTGTDTTINLTSEGNITGTGQIQMGENTSSASATTVFGVNNTASGDTSTISGGAYNVASGDFATIGGGRDNTASNVYTTVSGGIDNTASGGIATVGGGQENTANNNYATVGGGFANNASYAFATVGGGEQDTAKGLHAGVFSGFSNLAGDSPDDTAAFVGGGYNNSAIDKFATVAGGFTNSASEIGSTVGGGGNNTANGVASTIAGGSGNSTSAADGSTVGGGFDNASTGYTSTVAGGSDNAANGGYSSVGGGQNDTASGDYATVAGGYINTASGYGSTVGGGWDNTASNQYATVGGGAVNTASNNYATVGGGGYSTASGNYSTIAGGNGNIASGLFASIGGGLDDTASGNYSTVPGGFQNKASGAFSFAAGRQAKATHTGSFVWSSDAFSGTNFSSSAANQFNVRAPGGVRIYTNDTLASGVTMGAGANAWSAVSDKSVKKDFRSIDSDELLEKLSEIPISRWKYIAEQSQADHIGPMAQDFYSAFGLGDDDKRISTIDADGVALAAIQELYKQNLQLKKELEELRRQVKELDRK